MTRPWTPRLVAAALSAGALAASGCGESEEERYVDDYSSLNDRLLTLGRAIGTAPLDAGQESNAKLATRFGRYASGLDDLNGEIAALDTPGDLRDEATALTGSIAVVVKDLKRISAAARRGDGEAAAAATLALSDDSNKVNRAQNRLARATGADVGPR